MTHQLETECSGKVARDNHRGGETCDGQCRCESCWDYAPTDREVIAELRAQLKTRDLQLQQQNEQCRFLLAKLAEVRRERDEAKLELKRAYEDEEAAECKVSALATDRGEAELVITGGPLAGRRVVIGPNGGLMDPCDVPVNGSGNT